MTSRETCFLCFVQHDARVWKCLRDYFGLRKLKPWKTFSRSYLQRRKIEKRRQIEFSDNLRMPKLQENFTTQLSSWIIAMRDSLFYKMFSPLFCFEPVKTLKNFSKKLFTNKTKKIKEEGETKSSVWDLKKCLIRWKILEQSSGTRQVCAWVCSVIDHRRRQNGVKTSVTHSPLSLRLVCHFFVFNTFWRHLWSITEQSHGNMEFICYTEHSKSFFMCLMIKNPLNSPRVTFWYFQNKLLPDGVTALYSHKARFFNQSECALYLNFIIK